MLRQKTHDFIWCWTEYAQSIFGTTVRKSHSSCSEQQSIAAKRAECAAEFAAKKAEIKMEEEIAARKQELKRLENQRDRQVIEAKLKVYSKADPGEPSQRKFLLLKACSSIAQETNLRFSSQPHFICLSCGQV